ncbi:MAG: ribonuclease E/G, partial [Sphingomonadales bacterium]|nr:ribonuclease E/G [Sphingomonadales bacterium]
MTTRMLIDARHPEETRVAVLKGNRIEEFDFDSADHKQIKGNIYLAKVTRVEPSLQAAFVDFGGNRHGFLAFSEIHPDYYQIPKEDREALLAEEAAHAAEEAALRAAEDEEHDERDERDERDNGEFADDYESDRDPPGGITEIDTSEKDEVATIEHGHVENGFDHAIEEEEEGESYDDGRGDRPRNRRQGRGQAKGSPGQAEDLRARRMALRRRYKIQDVIQRRQVLLVQVVKEERGNKGAALTTYLSLAGRYCVLMPNSSHGGGISRKISSVADRKRLKSIIAELDLPKSMGCIVRTAGLQRTKVEIRRDFDYLARLWDDIRELTLKSSAPALIHSDSDLVKRAIRDLYNRDIEEVIVEGEAGYRLARDFMKLLMPSHARRVKAYVDPVPLFQRFGAEDQLSAMYDPVVQLRSGGYIVINPTEALVSIDINSGRSTKEHGIEATALNTNLEAAREIARQLRLRDMAGLVVIDFIDMEYSSNIRKVEKAMKDALKDDRARIQVGRISGFGLMEMSRQRLRTGVLEATTRGCPHCDGTGLVRTAASAGLSALRLIEEESARGRGTVITLFASQEAAIYLLNAKRADLAEVESRYGVMVEVIPEGENEGAKMRVLSSGPRNEFVPRLEPIALIEEEDELPEDYDEDAPEELREERRPEGDGDGRRKRRKRRRGRGRDQDEGESQATEAEGDDDAEPEADNEPTPAEAREEDGQAKRRRRGRRRRGGRNRGDGAPAEAGG